MRSENFTTTSMTISAILGLIKAEDIAIPEIQRPFVWKKAGERFDEFFVSGISCWIYYSMEESE